MLVFPGSGREVTKRKGEAYKVIWKERTGFARMAIEHGYPITPFASVGPEEFRHSRRCARCDEVARSARSSSVHRQA